MRIYFRAQLLFLLCFELNSQKLLQKQKPKAPGHGKIKSVAKQTFRSKNETDIVRRKIYLRFRSSCHWEYPNSSVPVFWLNLEDSVRRRRYFERVVFEVGYRNYRIRALTPTDYNVVVPCHSKPPRAIACLISHLAAIYTAVHDTSLVSSRGGEFALIVEDDVQFHFNIDFRALALSAPPDFGILQLMTSNDYYSRYLWDNYKKDHKLWKPRVWEDGYWSAQAYLINKKNIRKFIDQVVRVDEHGAVSFHLMTDLMHKRCMSGCVQPFCLAADTYIYNNGGPTYISTIPLFNGASVGYNSTIHQKDVNAHRKGFAVIDGVLSEVKSGNYSIPNFISVPRCFSTSFIS